MKKIKRIYFDHSATTPTDEKVLKVMMPYFGEVFGNPSSIHTFGQEAAASVDKARMQAASFLNCSHNEVIFTSGATESNNLALKGYVKALKNKGRKNIHLITSKVEHDSVLEVAKELERDGVEVTYLPVKKNGVVDIAAFKKALKPETVLVSIMYVNSEVGALQPIREIGKAIRKWNEARVKKWSKISVKDRGEKPEPIYFHTDATQAANYFSCDVEWNYIDMLSLSGHKIYGPKGIGLLYVRDGISLLPLQRGGHHERNLRSGTLNVPGIVGLGAALANITEKEREKQNKKVAALRDILVSEVQKKIPDVILNTDRENAGPSHAHFSFIGAEGESALISLDLEGFAVSTGSACASSSLKASYVLLAMGIKEEVAHHSIRFTLGKHNDKDDIDRLMKVLPGIITRLRKMNPLYSK